VPHQGWGCLRGWWGNPCGFQSRLRHHRNTERDFGFPPSSLFPGQFFLERIFPGSRIVSDLFKSSSDKTERAPRI